MASTPGQQSGQKPTIRGECQGGGQRETPEPEPQSFAVGEQFLFRSPGMDMEAGLRAKERQPLQKDEDTTVSLDLYIESLEVDAKEGGVVVPPSPWHSATDNSVDMYYGLEETALFPTSTVSTPLPASTAGLSTATCLSSEVSNKAAVKELWPDGENSTSSSFSSSSSSAVISLAAAMHLMPESHSRAKSHSARVLQSGRPHHAKGDQFSSTKSQQAEGRSRDDGSQKPGSAEYQQLLEKYRILRRNMVSLCCTAQREMQKKLQTITELRAAVHEFHRAAGGSGMSQPGAGKGPNPGSDASLLGDLSMPAQPLSFASRRASEDTNLHQSASCLSVSSHHAAKRAEVSASQKGLAPSSSDPVTAKSKIFSSVSTQAQFITTTQTESASTQTPSLKSLNKRVQTDSGKQVKRHTQTDMLRSVHELIQTESSVTLDKLLQTDLVGLVDKPVQTDPVNDSAVDKQVQTRPPRCVSKSVETDLLVDVAVDKSTLTDSQKPGNVDETECTDSVVDLGMENPLQHHSPNHIDDQTGAVMNEVPYNSCELKERDEAVEFSDARHSPAYPGQVAQGEVLQQARSRGSKRHLEPSSRSEYVESKRARCRVLSDECQTRYSSDNNDDVFLNPRHASDDSNFSVDVKSLSDQYSPAYGEEASAKTTAEHCENVGIMSRLHTGSASGVIVSEPHKSSDQSFQNTADSFKQMVAKAAPVQVRPKKHSPLDTEGEHCFTQDHVDAAPCQAGQGARVAHCPAQPLHRPWVWGSLKDVRGEAWKRRLLFWPSYTHRRVSRRSEIDAVFSGENHPKVYDWSSFSGSSLELEQEPPEQDQTQRHDPSHLQADWTPYGPQLEDAIEEGHQPHTSPDFAAADDEGHSAMFDTSIPGLGRLSPCCQTDNPNLTPSVSTSSATGSVHKHKKKKKKKDRKKSRHSADKAEEKKEKRKKKQKKKDDLSMKDNQSEGLQERSETDLRQSHGMTVSDLNFVDVVDQRDFVQDADGLTLVREMCPNDEGNDSNVYSKTNMLSSVEDDIDRKLASHHEISSESLKNAFHMKTGITDHEERALCTNPKDKELIEKMTVNTSQEEDRDISHEMTVNVMEDGREKDSLSVINAKQDNNGITGSSKACTDSSEEEQFPCDKGGNGDSDFSIHTDDSDSEEWSVEKSSKHVSHQSLNTQPSSETAFTCADDNTLMSENEPGMLCNEIVVGRGEAVTIDETSHHTGFFSVTKDIRMENDGDTSASVYADDFKGPGEEGNMGRSSNDSACVNEVEKLKDGFKCQEQTFESASNDVVDSSIKLIASSIAAEDGEAQDKLQTVFVHERTSLGNVLNVPTSMFGVCENSLHQQHDDIGEVSEGESADQPWAHLPSDKAGNADHREGGKQVTFVPHHRETTSQGDADGLLTTRIQTAPEEENTTSTNLSGIPTTPVGYYQLPVTPKKNWLLRTKQAVEGEDSTSLFSAIKSASTRDLSDPSFIWSPDKTSSNNLSLREPIGHDTFYNMLGMPCNSSTSSDESLARNIPFTNLPPLKLVKNEGVLEEAKPSQPILSSQQMSDLQIPGNQSHLEKQLDMDVEEEVEEGETDSVHQPAGTEDKTPLFGYPSAGLRDSTAHRFAYKRRPLHLPPSSSSSASSVTASRSSSLTSASLSSLPTEPPPSSQMLTNRASQKLKAVKEDGLVQGDRGVKDEEMGNSSGLLSTSRVSLSGNTGPSGKGVQLVCPQPPEVMIQSERKKLLYEGNSGQKSQIMAVVEEADESLKEASDSAHGDSHKVTSQMGANKEQPVQDFSLQIHQSDHVNITKDPDSKVSSVSDLRASASAIHIQRRNLEEGEVDSRDSLCPTPKAVVGNSKGSFTSTLRDIKEQSLEEGEIQSSDESDANNDQNLSCDDVKISVQSDDDLAELQRLKEALTRKSKRRLSPDTSIKIKPASKKQKTRTEKAMSDAHSSVQPLAPKAAAPKSSGGKDREQKAGHDQSGGEHSDEKENGQVDQQAQQRRQRNRDRLERVRRQIVGYKPFQKEHSELKSFTIPKKNRGTDGAQVQKDQNWTPEDTRKASSHKYSGKKGVRDSVELSKCNKRKETGREKDDRGRRLGMEKDHRERRTSRERDSSDRRLGEERDVRCRKHSEEGDGRYRRSSEDREVRHRRYSEERDPRYRRDSHDKERDLRHRRYSQEREDTHRRHNDERDGRHRKHSEERENRHRRHSEERENRHRRHSEEGENRHRRHSEGKESRHGRHSKERDRHRRDSEERENRDRRCSKGRDVFYERHSKERDGRLRRPSGEKDGGHRRYSKERDCGDRRYSRKGDERYREQCRHKDSGIESCSKESDVGDSVYNKEKCGRDRQNSREGSDKDAKCTKERDNKDTTLGKSVDDKSTQHGKQAVMRQESEHQSAAKHSTKSVDTGRKHTMSKADMYSVASPRFTASSVSPAHGCPDISAPLSPSVTRETEYVLSQLTDDRSGPKHLADGHHVPTNCGTVDQVPSESSEGSRQLSNDSSIKEKQSPKETSPEKRPLPQRPLPQEGMIPAEPEGSGLIATKLQHSEDVLDNGEHFSGPSQSEEESQSDGNFSVSDSDSECSDSLTDPEIEGSIRTRGFLYYRDRFKPRPELEMSIEDLEELENDMEKEEEENGCKSEEDEDSEHEDEDDSCDEDESGEENMSEDDEDEDDDENQGKPNDEADNMDTDDNWGDSGKPEGCDEKTCEHQDPRHAEDSDAFCRDSDSEMADGSDFSEPTADCTTLCAEVSVHPGEKTSAFSVYGHDQYHTAKKRGHSSGNQKPEKPAPCTDGNGSGEGSDRERVMHPVRRHCQIQSASPPGYPVYRQVSSDSLSLHASDDIESFLLGDLSHPQDGGGKTAVGNVWGCSLGSRITAERSSPQ